MVMTEVGGGGKFTWSTVESWETADCLVSMVMTEVGGGESLPGPQLRAGRQQTVLSPW